MATVKIMILGDTWPFPMAGDAYHEGEPTWFQTTEAISDHALGAVPPVYFSGGFFMGEAHSHDERGVAVHAAFVQVGGRHYMRNVARDRIADVVTELHHALSESGTSPRDLSAGSW